MYLLACIRVYWRSGKNLRRYCHIYVCSESAPARTVRSEGGRRVGLGTLRGYKFSRDIFHDDVAYGRSLRDIVRARDRISSPSLIFLRFPRAAGSSLYAMSDLVLLTAAS